MRPKVWMLAVATFMLLASATALAEPIDWRSEKSGPSFPEMVDEAANIIFGQITGITATTVEVSVSKAIKGKVHDKIVVTGLKNHPTIKIPDLRKHFKRGDDYFFFLNAAMVGSIPFEAVKNSILVRVDRDKVRLSILAPTIEKYRHELKFDLFESFLVSLIANGKGQAINPTFLGKLIQNLEQAAADPNSTMAASYLAMVLPLKPDYDNLAVLFGMLDSADINSRLMAIQTLGNLADQLKTEKAEKPKKKKKKKSKRAKKRASAEATFTKRIYKRLINIMKTDKSPLVQSVNAVAITQIHNDKAINELAEMIEKVDMKEPEQCELYPALGEMEPPKKAILRAVVEFESDLSLDVLERELRRDEVGTFRLILEIFRDYSDVNLNLLLLDLLQDRNFLPRQVAILEHFRRIKDEETIQGLKDLYVSPEVGSEYIRKSILEVFDDFKDPRNTVEFIIKNGLHDPSPVVRQAAARALGNLGDPMCVTAFKDIYFKESNRLAREFYVEALSKIKSRLAHEALLWLKEKETDVHMLKQIRFALKKSKYLSR